MSHEWKIYPPEFEGVYVIRLIGYTENQHKRIFGHDPHIARFFDGKWRHSIAYNEIGQEWEWRPATDEEAASAAPFPKNRPPLPSHFAYGRQA